MLNPATTARRALPSVDRLLKQAAIRELVSRYGHALVVETLRVLLDEQRAAMAASSADSSFDETALVAGCAARLAAQSQPSLRRVFNLTGTVLHTNLGRACMPRSAALAVAEAMMHPVNLEFDLDGGGRGERDSHIERLLVRLTGAEAALVVNNNAAAVYLALNTIASKREVIVSRGELIEIGGAFRVPDIMARSGCKLKEVGTTNRTHPADYAAAISSSTAAVMKVHTSNYSIEGFTAAVSEAELAAIAHERGLPFIVDLGSGMLVDLERYGLPHEPTPREALAHGADLVTFSGDKLLGGPQAGLVVGKKDLVARLRKNPLKRALRVDKMTLTALESVLQLYLNPERLADELPTLRWLTRPVADIEAQAARVLPHVAAAMQGAADVSVIPCMSQIGSGSLPVDLLPSAGIGINGGKRQRSFPDKIASAFRGLPIPVVGRIKDGAFIMDLRCLDDEAAFIAQLGALGVSSGTLKGVRP
ncbi:MAG: L-seryl-tRNA(Sec) selenium transferase [Betaproteobacteria bacterium]